MRPNEERRYSTARWRNARAAVLVRDMHRCWVTNCPIPANVADHIDPVYPGMPDHEFFAMSNLRASCKRHNTARGVAARLQRETEGGVEPEPTRNVLTSRGSFLRGRKPLDVGSPGTELEFAL